MENSLVWLLKCYKHGNKDSFVEICSKMNPLITKYARILKFEELDDMKSELTLALLECVERIEMYENEQEVLHYIQQAILNKFHELYRVSKKQLNEVNLNHEDTEFNDVIFRFYPKDFGWIIYENDMMSYIASLPEGKRGIAREVLLKGTSDSEIGTKFHVTRQYVHRLRKEFYQHLCESYR